MAGFFHPLLAMLASATQKELARQIQYLKAENRILRAKLPRVLSVTPAERRRLVRLGRAIGPAIRHLMTIVSYRTFCRWLGMDRNRKKPANRGRPRTAEEIRDLILRLARETGWGYTRILGELRKLGVRGVSRTTVLNILHENGFDPGPKRGEGTWDEFIRIHAKTLWACDFIQKKIVTVSGLVDFFILFFIHVGSRRVYVSGITAQPDARWMSQQSRNFSIHVQETGEQVTHLIRDGDKKFTGDFDAILEGEGAKIVHLPPAAPNMNAYAERWAQTLQSECLDHFVILGQSHLQLLVSEFVAHYLGERPHQGVGNVPLTAATVSAPPEKGRILCKERLGGLLRHYYRKAA